MSLRMLTNLRLADLRLTTAQQRTTGQNLPSVLYSAAKQSDIVCIPSSGDALFHCEGKGKGKVCQFHLLSSSP
jgi:hypothetical protein